MWTAHLDLHNEIEVLNWFLRKIPMSMKAIRPCDWVHRSKKVQKYKTNEIEKKTWRVQFTLRVHDENRIFCFWHIHCLGDSTRKPIHIFCTGVVSLWFCQKWCNRNFFFLYWFAQKLLWDGFFRWKFHRIEQLIMDSMTKTKYWMISNDFWKVTFMCHNRPNVMWWLLWSWSHVPETVCGDAMNFIKRFIKIHTWVRNGPTGPQNDVNWSRWVDATESRRSDF